MSTLISLKNFRHLRALTYSLVAVLALSVGCKPSDSDPVAKASPKSTVTGSTVTTSVLPTKTTSAVSPAQAELAKDTFDQTATGVCQRFMEMLQSAKQIGAENLLTRTARHNTSSANLKLQPMGGPNATFKIGEASYATNRQKLAHVDCLIVDKVDGETVETKMTWQVRKRGKSWRISGVMLELEPNSKPNLLSFENSSDVATIKMLAGEDVLNEPPTRSASNPATETKLK